MSSNSAVSSSSADGLCDIRSLPSQSLLSQLGVVAAAAEGAAGALTSNSEGALLEALRLYGRGLDLARTLRTICRTNVALDSADTSAQRCLSVISSHCAKLEIAAEALREALESLVSVAPNAGGNAELKLWRTVLCGRLRLKPEEASRDALMRQVASQVLQPTLSVYTHLTGTCVFEVQGSDGWTGTQSFSASLAVLKNSDDPLLRRSTFEKLNAWLASHASSLLDVLNAATGFRVLAAQRPLQRPDAAAANVLRLELARERVDEAVYDAMFCALESALPQLREAVTLRQRAFGGGPMKLWNLLSAAPSARYARERTLKECFRHLSEAFGDWDPEFPKFLEEVRRRGWLNASRSSKKSSGGWSDDLPAVGAVRMVTNYLPTLGGEAALAHLFGAAYQMYLLHDAPAPARLYPLSITEIAAGLCETRLLQSLAASAKARKDDEELASLEWQALRRITNCCLIIPSRHRLLKNVLQARSSGALSLTEIAGISREAWEHYFADTTDGADRYVWAYKPHFYRRDPVFYDWQYTLGFLLSYALLKFFSVSGKSACGADLRKTIMESSGMSVAEFGRRHLGADLSKEAFWKEALSLALTPVEFSKRNPRFLTL